MTRSARAELARDTVRIAEQGYYTLPDGRVIGISAAVRDCLAGTRYYSPDAIDELQRDVLSRPPAWADTSIEVVNETTLAGVARLVGDGGPVAALNFASAKNPGGGFLNGSQAQEESLARSSALYPSLLRAGEYYNSHRAAGSHLYSDAVIVSPGCPVFRDDAGNLLADPHRVAFVTCAAPNAGAAADNRPSELPHIPAAFLRRTACVLAAASGCPDVVLGAWGCGVFRNDPRVVAAAFAAHFVGGAWPGRFRRVVFSVLDTSRTGDTIAAFREAFAG